MPPLRPLALAQAPRRCHAGPRGPAAPELPPGPARDRALVVLLERLAAAGCRAAACGLAHLAMRGVPGALAAIVRSPLAQAELDDLTRPAG